MHIIKTTASIPAKFCTAIKTTIYPYVCGPNTHIADAIWWMVTILKNRKIAISRPHFDRFRPSLARRRSSAILSSPTVKNWNLKNPRWRRPPFWKIEKRHISVAFWPISTKFGTGRSSALLSHLTLKNLKFEKSKMAADAILKNRKIAISHPYFDRFWPNLARPCSSALLSSPTVKNSKFENPRWRRPPCWKVEKSPCFGRSFTDFDQIWLGRAVRPSWAIRLWIFQILKIQDGGRLLSWNLKIAISRSCFDRLPRNLARLSILTFRTLWAIKIIFFKSKMTDSIFLNTKNRVWLCWYNDFANSYLLLIS